MPKRNKLNNERHSKTLMITDDWANRELIANITDSFEKMTRTVNKIGKL